MHLTERSRRFLALGLVALAFVHLSWPDLGIDGVFLGLLGLAVLVLFFDIDSIEALGVKAKARKIQRTTKEVATAHLPEGPLEMPIPLAPSERGAPGAAAASFQLRLETVDREPFERMPPTEPVARILWGVEQIRIELIVVAGCAGHLKTRKPWGEYRVMEVVDPLARNNLVPGSFVEPIKTLLDTRNALAHGRHVPSFLLESSDELTMTLLARLRELPREYIRVLDPSLSLYVDRSLTTPHPYPGVLLEKRDRDGNLINVSAFPTEQEYRKGRFVTWEWDLSKGSDEEAWYMDPEADGAVMAFSSAAAFSGREFPEQWGLEYRAGPIPIMT